MIHEEESACSSSSSSAVGALTVVVVCFRSADVLPGFIDGLGKLHAALSLDVVLVVNDGETAYEELLDDRPFESKVVYSAGNIGFGRAANLGVESSSGSLVLIANPDVVIDDPAPVITAASLVGSPGHPARLCGFNLYRDTPGDTPRIYAPISRRQLLAHAIGAPHRATTVLAKLPGLRTLAGLRSYEGVSVESADDIAVEVVPGALILADRSVFSELGGFDPGFFLNAEDVDLCNRVRQRWGAGAVHFVRGAGIRHAVGASKASAARSPLFVLQGEILYALRYFGTGFARLLIALLFVRRWWVPRERTVLWKAAREPRRLSLGCGLMETLIAEAP